MAMADLEAFKAQLDIVALAEACTGVKRVGTGGKILCPEHDDSDPSCQLYGTTNSYFCWSCKAHGDVFKLVMLLRNLSFPEAIDWIAETANLERPNRDPEQEARAAALKVLRLHFSEGLDALPGDGGLPGDLTPERARSLGLGYAKDLGAISAQLPRHILNPREIAAWEGAWTLELYGRGGGILGFGAFLPIPAAKPEALSKIPTSPEGAPIVGAVPAESPAEAPEGVEEDSSPDAADAEYFSEVDPEDTSSEEYESTADLTKVSGAKIPPSVSPATKTAEESPAMSGRAPEDASPSQRSGSSGKVVLGPFVRAAALRAPSFAGLPGARETIARRKAVALSPDMATFLELQASGFTGVIATGAPLDGPAAAALASLAPQIIVVVSPAYRASGVFLGDLNLLAATGAHVELISKPGEGANQRASLFEYLASAAVRAREAGRPENMRPILGRYLEVLPSRSTRALYAAELRARDL